MRLLPNWLTQRAALTPDRVALVAGKTRLTFGGLAAQTRDRALSLAALGVKAGDTVALLMRNSVEYVVLMHAVHLQGAVLVPLNTRLSATEIAWQLGNVQATLLLCDEANALLATAAQAEQPTIPLRRLPLADVPADLSVRMQRDHHALDEVHSIIHTSGTMGRPKGALLTFGNFWWSSVGSALNLGHHLDDCWLCCLPLFHVGGLSVAVKSVIYGISMVLHEGFDAAAVNRSIDEDGVTIVSAVAVMLARMLEQRGGQPYPPTLRCVLLGGGPAPAPLLEACAARHIPVVQTYGLTEAASQVATLAPADALRKLGSAGKPLMPTELRIVGAAEGRWAAAGEIGEIIVRGPTISPGYLNHPEATGRAVRDGWLHTGDLGYLDADGYLYVVDRRDDLIISGGENVYPAEVEAVLLAHPDVAEAAVIGLPDAQWGQVPVAAVRLRVGTSVSPHALREFCLTRLARYKTPTQIRIVSDLPHTAAGKLLRRRVAETWTAHADGSTG